MNDEPSHADGIPIDLKSALLLGKSEPMSWIVFAFNSGLVLLVVPAAIEMGGHLLSGMASWVPAVARVLALVYFLGAVATVWAEFNRQRMYRRLARDMRQPDETLPAPDAIGVVPALFYRLVDQLVPTWSGNPEADKRVFARLWLAGTAALRYMIEADDDIRFAVKATKLATTGSQPAAASPPTSREIGLAFRAGMLVSRWSCAYGYARGIHRAEPADPRDETAMMAEALSSFGLLYDVANEVNRAEAEADRRVAHDKREMLAAYDAFHTGQPSQAAAVIELFHVALFDELMGKSADPLADLLGGRALNELEERTKELPSTASGLPGDLRSDRASRWEGAFVDGMRDAWSRPEGELDRHVAMGIRGP